MFSKDRKYLQLAAAIFLILGIAFWAYGMSLEPLPGRGPANPEELNPSDWVKLGSAILSIAGTAAYARSKGYSAWFGLLGFLGCIGLFILFRLPNRWGIETAPPAPDGLAPGDYPRPQG